MGWRWLLFPLGLVLVFFGVAIGLVGGYLINGESQSRPREGIPIAIAGCLLFAGGVVSFIYAFRAL